MDYGKHLTGFTLLLCLVSACTWASVDEEQARELISTYSGTNKLLQKKTAERLTYWGVENKKVFELIDNLIKKEYKNGKQDKEQADYVSWLLKGLAASGDEKYRSTLEEVKAGSTSSKVRKYASQALEELEKYKLWNPIINQPLDSDAAKLNFREKNYLNMLSAKDLELVRIGAKRISYEEISNPIVAQGLNDRLLELYMSANDNLSIDTAAWVIKALSTCGGADYKSTFLKVENEAPNRKVRKYAKKYGSRI